jgi:ribosomal protein L10
VAPGGVPLQCLVAQQIEEPAEAISNRSLIERLQSSAYNTRRLAGWELKQKRGDAIPIIDQALQTADADLTRTLVRLLSELASTPNRSPGPEAVAVLRTLAEEQVTFRGSLAKQTLQALADQQAQMAIENLEVVGVKFKFELIQILTSRLNTPVPFAVIDEEFAGTAKDLRSLRWIDQYKIVVLQGPKIDAEVIEQVAQMPNLEVLQIREANLAAKDLMPLQNLRQLKTLELSYFPISDDDMELIATFPIWESIRFFGTEVTREGLEKFSVLQPDIEVSYGLGGFLGISAAPMGACVIGSFVEDSAAQEAGMELNDIITSINDVPVTEFEDLRQELAKYAVDESVHLVAERMKSGERAPQVLEFDAILKAGPRQ